MMMLYFLLIALPLTVVCWGGFWLVRWGWSALPMTAWEQRWCRWLLVWVVVTLAELSVLVYVAAERHP